MSAARYSWYAFPGGGFEGGIGTNKLEVRPNEWVPVTRTMSGAIIG